jgi:hypothetical protein
VNSGTYLGQSPSPGGIQWHAVTKRDNGHFNKVPGQGQKSPTHDRRPQQDSNLRSRLRRRAVRFVEFMCAICWYSTPHLIIGRNHSAHIPDHGLSGVATMRLARVSFGQALARTRPFGGKHARTLQGMARVRPGQAPACPLASDRSARRGSRVKRDFACTCTRHPSPVLVARRSQSCLRLEGRTRTLSGPAPALASI